MTELTAELETLQRDNKLLRREHRQQERRLEQYEVQENNMPTLIQHQTDEVNALREHLRRQREKCEKKEKKLRETTEELERTQRLLKKMKGLVDDKKLGEREALSRKLTTAESDRDERDKTIEVSNIEPSMFSCSDANEVIYGMQCYFMCKHGIT